MDVKKLLEIAALVGGGPLLAEGLAFAEKVVANAKRAKGVLTDADQAELDAIHAEALAANERLDAALAEAEKR